MLARTLNLGILAHVDAGKTSLTEQILFHTGVIPAPGRVDHGTTQTDTLELERQRGITIQTAVASFRLGDLQVNLVDTPGHSDFIAEVDRALRVLDAVILVVSAVEGVQSQTRKLGRAIVDAGLPMIIFINKIDRAGSRSDALVEDIERWLDLRAVPMTSVTGLGTRDATVVVREPDISTMAILADHDDDLLGRYLDGECAAAGELRAGIARQVTDTAIVPIFHGSALMGVGVDLLLEAIPTLLRSAPQPPSKSLCGVVFKVQRATSSERAGLVRLFGGTLAVREVVPVHRLAADPAEARITALERIQPGGFDRCAEAAGGDIVRIHGLEGVRVGDVIGDPAGVQGTGWFPAPTLESVVRSTDPALVGRLYDALVELEGQDPMIRIRRGERDRTIALRLYGEVQKEVIAATLADLYGVDVEFDSRRVICIERVIGAGSASEVIGQGSPFPATVHLELRANPLGAGLTYWARPGALDHAFYRAIEETVRLTLAEGLCGWEIPDVDIRVPDVGMVPNSVAGDYRNVVPLVLMNALREAGTEVCEPIEQFTLDVPVDDVGDAYSMLATAGATPYDMVATDDMARITGEVALENVHELELHLPGLARGRAMFAAVHGGYRPIRGEPPVRERTDFNPLNRKEYLARLSQG